MTLGRIACLLLMAGELVACSNGSPAAQSPTPASYLVTGFVTEQGTAQPVAGARVEVLNGLNTGKFATTDGTGAYRLAGLIPETFHIRASFFRRYDASEQSVTVPATERADFALRKSSACAYTLLPSVFVLPNVGGTFLATVTQTTADACPWTAATSDAWIAVTRQAGRGGTGTIAFSADSTSPERDGTITVSWSGGMSDIVVVQARSRLGCTPTASTDLTADGQEQFVTLGLACALGGTGSVTIDVPWMRVRSTSPSTTVLDLVIDVNTGAARTGHVVLADGNAVYLQITVNQQAGNTSVASGGIPQ